MDLRSGIISTMNKVICVWKPLGLTPLQTLDALRVKFLEYKDKKLSYAGRLDPMAEGVMLVLVGEENKNREEHLRVDKEYEFEVLFGIKSDTFDLMGMPEYEKTHVKEKELVGVASDLVGSIEQEYPPFSGKTINGVKMFDLAKEGRLPKDLPKLKGRVFKAELLGVEKREFGEVIEKVNDVVSDVVGDFRQNEILSVWNMLEIDKDEEFVVAGIKLSCSSGVFMRAIVSEMGKKMGGVALAYSIKRTRVDKYMEKDCIKI